jgi:hypothetical protein
MTKIRKILEQLIKKDDEGRNKVEYDLNKTLTWAEQKILNLKIKDVK